MATDSHPWDDLPPYEVERIVALPFDDMIAELCSFAPKESARSIGQFLDKLGNAHPAREVKRARAAWKAAGGHLAKGVQPHIPAVPTREVMIQKMHAAAELGNAVEAGKWAGAIQMLDKIDGIGTPEETGEDWERLSDLEAGALVALTHKLYGEHLTPGDLAWLARLT